MWHEDLHLGYLSLYMSLCVFLSLMGKLSKLLKRNGPRVTGASFLVLPVPRVLSQIQAAPDSQRQKPPNSDRHPSQPWSL